MAKQQPPHKRELRATSESQAIGEVEVIVKVLEPNYVPKGVMVRAQISPLLFTGVLPGSKVEALEADPGVVSVSVSQTLRTIG